jgi:ubiquitin carboxyl-terminal hydrolase 7
LTLSRSMLYDVVAAKVGEKLNAAPQNIRFTAPGVSGTPKTVIRHLPSSTLLEMIQSAVYNGVNVPTLFYEVLDIPLSELETKKQVKVTVLTPTLSDETTHDLVLPKDNKISDLLQALEAKGVKFESESGTRLPRIFEAVQNKFIRELDMNEPISSLTDAAYCTLYAEVTKLLCGSRKRFIYFFFWPKSNIYLYSNLLGGSRRRNHCDGR